MALGSGEDKGFGITFTLKSEKAQQFCAVAPNLVWLLSSPQQPRDGRIHQPPS